MFLFGKDPARKRKHSPTWPESVTELLPWQRVIGLGGKGYVHKHQKQGSNKKLHMLGKWGTELNLLKWLFFDAGEAEGKTEQSVWLQRRDKRGVLRLHLTSSNARHFQGGCKTNYS